MEQERNTAYRDLRVTAYRKKYEPALSFGGKTLTYGVLLNRVEYAYNTFCQMGVSAGDRVCLWLPNCPDLLAGYYALSRLGAVAVLSHPGDLPREVRRQMDAAGAALLITTADRYERYCRDRDPLPPGQVVLCKPESDMKGAERRRYRESLSETEERNEQQMDELLRENSYTAMDIPYSGEQEAVLLCGTSSFRSVRFVSYFPEELADTAALFWRRKDGVGVVYVENSFATEGGFLAAHSVLVAGKTLLWSVGEPYKMLKKKKPDFLVATEEFFWEFRKRASFFGTKWKNLQGGYQIGKALTPLMEKFASKAMASCGGVGVLSGSPVPLKVRKEDLYFVKDYGIRTTDLEEELSALAGIRKCRCIAENGGLRLRVLPDGTASVSGLGRAMVVCCKKEMNPLHLPKSVEFCSSL